MRDINVVAKKMARNGFKIAKSLGWAFHFESEFLWQLDNIWNFMISTTCFPRYPVFWRTGQAIGPIGDLSAKSCLIIDSEGPGFCGHFQSNGWQVCCHSNLPWDLAGKSQISLFAYPSTLLLRKFVFNFKIFLIPLWQVLPSIISICIS